MIMINIGLSLLQRVVLQVNVNGNSRIISRMATHLSIVIIFIVMQPQLILQLRLLVHHQLSLMNSAQKWLV
jgi:hypothetical protein